MTMEALSNQINVDELFDLAAGDPEIVGEILAAFREEYPLLMEGLRRGVERHDPEVVRDRAHALKGVCATLGAPKAREQSFALETMGKNGDLSGAVELLERFEGIMEKVRAELALVEDELNSSKHP